MTVESSWTNAQEIRTMFRTVEQQRWGPREYAIETLVQIGHLGDVLLRQKHKLKTNTVGKTNRTMGDEIVDILLNNFSLADELGISLNEYLSINHNQLSWSQLSQSLCTECNEDLDVFALYSKCAEASSSILLEMNQTINVDRHKIIQYSKRLLCGLVKIADVYSIDIDEAFVSMRRESSEFVKDNS